jgi:hypothetical protein
MAVKNAARPAGKPDSQHAYKDEASNSLWLAEFEWREPGVPGAPLVVVISIEDVDGVREEGPLSWTFSETQLAEPDFDPEAYVEALVAERVSRSVNIRSSRKKVEAFKRKRKPKEQAEVGPIEDERNSQ